MSNANTTERWILNLSAILAQMNNVCCEKMILGEPDDTQLISQWRKALDRDWGVTDYKTLLENVDWLLHQGHNCGFTEKLNGVAHLSQRSFDNLMQFQEEATYNQLCLVFDNRFPLKTVGVRAWDIGRMVFLMRQAVYVGYIGIDEAWQILLTVALEAQKIFAGWDHYGHSYVVGRHYWRSISLTEGNCEKFYEYLNPIIGDFYSPWYTLPWDMPLSLSA